MNFSDSKRNVSIDLIKVFAIIGVVIIHTCTFDTPIASADWNFALFWRSISGASVPLFLMSSGAIMLEQSKDISFKKLYKKNILRIILSMFVWAAIYKIYHLNDAENLSFHTALDSFYEIIFFNHEFHFYYMHMIIIVYMFLPVTRTLVKHSGQKQLLYILFLWFAFAIIYPTIKRFYPFSFFEGMTTMWGINLTYASIGFGILGYYLKKYPLTKLYSLILAFSGFGLVFGLTFFKSFTSGILYEHFLAGNGLPVCIMAAGIFSFLVSVNLESTGICFVLTSLSKSSFCIYLVHMLVMYILKSNGINTSFAPKIISIPSVAVLNIAISYAVYFVLSKIPIVKNWLI